MTREEVRPTDVGKIVLFTVPSEEGRKSKRGKIVAVTGRALVVAEVGHVVPPRGHRKLHEVPFCDAEFEEGWEAGVR